MEQQQKYKKKEKSKDDIDLELEQQLNTVEQENKMLVKEARSQIHKGATKQRQVTKELMRQGEKISNISENAAIVYENAKTGRELTQNIHDEGRFFKFPHVFRGIKKFFSADKKNEAELDKQIKKDKIKEKEKKLDDLKFKENESDTEENMKLLLDDLKNMRGEAEVQNKEVKKQKLDIKQINKLSKQSEHIMNKTTQDLRKI